MRRVCFLVLFLSIVFLASSTLGADLLYADTSYFPTITGGIKPPPTPTPTLTPSPTPSPTPPPPPVEILDNHYLYKSTNVIRVVGEIQNNTSSNIETMRVATNLLNEYDQIVATGNAYVELESLPPGEKTCFSAFFSLPPKAFSYSFEGVDYEVGTSDTRLTVVSTHGTYSSPYHRYTAVGQIKNEGSTEARHARGVGTLYDSRGRAIRCNYSYVNSTHLSPGQASGVQVDFLELEGISVGTFRLQATAFE